MLFRLLDKEAMGTWALLLTLTSILEVGRIGLIQNGLVKHLAPAQGPTYNTVFYASLTLHLLLAATISMGVWVSAPLLAHSLQLPLLASLLRIYALTTLLLTPFFHFNFVQQAQLSFKGVFYSNVVRQLTFFLVVLYFWWQELSPPLHYLAWAQVGAATAGSCVATFTAWPYLCRPQKPDKQWMRTLLAFGKYTLGTNLSTMLYRSIDKLMLGILPNAGATGIALYEAAIKINNLADVPTHSLASLVFPQSALRVEAQGLKAVGILYEKAVGAILTPLVPAVIGVWLTAPWCIQFIAGPGYAQSVPILRITILFALFLPFAVQFGTIMDAIGHQRLNFQLTLLGALLNMACNFLFINAMGVIGAAWGTLLTYFILFLLMQWQLRKHLDVRWWRCFVHSWAFAQKGIALVQCNRAGTTKTTASTQAQPHVTTNRTTHE